MHRIMLVLVLANAGCWGKSRTPGRVGGGVVAGLGTVMLVDGLTSDCDQHIEDLDDGVGCGITKEIGPWMGGTMLVIGLLVLIGNELRDLDPPPETVVQPPAVTFESPPAPETADPMLRQLTLQASVAARTGHCSTVTAIASRVARIDPVYRREGFERDGKIVSCLQN
jgi:hypothetical protein